MNEYVILVDEQDQEIGYSEKLEAHKKGLLHRAFSIFIYDCKNKKMLLQKRAVGKYHSGGLWTNACCSHPRKGETMEEALRHRLKVELNFDTSFHILDSKSCGELLAGADVIYSCGSFQYYAPFENLSEHEIDHVFLYSPYYDEISESDFVFNPEEVEEIKWVTIEELTLWMNENPEEFTAWFKRAYELAEKVIRKHTVDEFFEDFREGCRLGLFY